jgi:hypothetical protein
MKLFIKEIEQFHLKKKLFGKCIETAEIFENIYLV